MKLRNKKTGNTKDLETIIHEAFKVHEVEIIKSIEANWEDVDSTNTTNIPLIKDEKVRKAVRAWLEANGLDGATYYTSSYHWYLRSFNHREQGIDFWLNIEDESNLNENEYYTKAELCGEEEVCKS